MVEFGMFSPFRARVRGGICHEIFCSVDALHKTYLCLQACSAYHTIMILGRQMAECLAVG